MSHLSTRIDKWRSRRKKRQSQGAVGDHWSQFHLREIKDCTVPFASRAREAGTYQMSHSGNDWMVAHCGVVESGEMDQRFTLHMWGPKTVTFVAIIGVLGTKIVVTK